MQITAQLFQNLTENSPIATLVVSGPEAQVLVANATFCELVLHRSEELLGHSLYEVPARKSRRLQAIDR